MSNKKKIVSVAFTSVAATAITALAAAPALAAASTWTVTNGGHYKALNSGATGAMNTFRDENMDASITCFESDVIGSVSIPSAVSIPGKSIGSFTEFEPGYSGATHACNGPFNTRFNGHALNHIHVNAVSQSAGGLVHMTLTGMSVAFTAVASLARCTASFVGDASGSYNSLTGYLKISKAKMIVRNVSGCLGFLKNGDSATYVGRITINPSKSVKPKIKHNLQVISAGPRPLLGSFLVVAPAPSEAICTRDPALPTIIIGHS